MKRLVLFSVTALFLSAGQVFAYTCVQPPGDEYTAYDRSCPNAATPENQYTFSLRKLAYDRRVYMKRGHISPEQLSAKIGKKERTEALMETTSVTSDLQVIKDALVTGFIDAFHNENGWSKFEAPDHIKKRIKKFAWDKCYGIMKEKAIDLLGSTSAAAVKEALGTAQFAALPIEMLNLYMKVYTSIEKEADLRKVLSFYVKRRLKHDMKRLRDKAGTSDFWDTLPKLSADFILKQHIDSGTLETSDGIIPAFCVWAEVDNDLHVFTKSYVFIPPTSFSNEEKDMMRSFADLWCTLKRQHRHGDLQKQIGKWKKRPEMTVALLDFKVTQSLHSLLHSFIDQLEAYYYALYTHYYRERLAENVLMDICWEAHTEEYNTKQPELVDRTYEAKVKRNNRIFTQIQLTGDLNTKLDDLEGVENNAIIDDDDECSKQEQLLTFLKQDVNYGYEYVLNSYSNKKDYEECLALQDLKTCRKSKYMNYSRYLWFIDTYGPDGPKIAKLKERCPTYRDEYLGVYNAYKQKLETRWAKLVSEFKKKYGLIDFYMQHYQQFKDTYDQDAALYQGNSGRFTLDLHPLLDAEVWPLWKGEKGLLDVKPALLALTAADLEQVLEDCERLDQRLRQAQQVFREDLEIFPFKGDVEPVRDTVREAYFLYVDLVKPAGNVGPGGITHIGPFTTNASTTWSWLNQGDFHIEYGATYPDGWDLQLDTAQSDMVNFTFEDYRKFAEYFVYMGDIWPDFKTSPRKFQPRPVYDFNLLTLDHLQKMRNRLRGFVLLADSIQRQKLTAAYELIDDFNSPILAGIALEGEIPEPGMTEFSSGFGYTAAGPDGLVALESSSPGELEKRDSQPIAGGYGYGLSMNGNIVFLAAGSAGLVSIDVSNPDNLVVLDTYDTPGTCYAVKVAAGYAFVADGNNGLVILDVSDPEDILFAGQTDLSGEAVAIDIHLPYAYVAMGENGLVVVDCNNYAAPVVTATLDTDGNAQAVAYRTPYVYVADGTGGVLQVDPNPVGMFVADALDLRIDVQDIRFSGNLAYVLGPGIDAGSAHTAVFVIEVTTDQIMFVNTGVDLSATTHNIAVNDSYAYASCFADEGFHKIDVSHVVQDVNPILSISVSGNGSGTVTVLPGGDIASDFYSKTFPDGTAITVQASPGEHSVFAGFTSGPCDGTGDCLFTMDGNAFVEAAFDRVEHDITVSSNEGGSISDSGGVPHGSGRYVSIQPDEGYVVSSVVIDGGQELGAMSGHGFENVTGDHTLEVTFAEIPPDAFCVVTAGGESGGTVSPSGMLELAEGGHQLFTISAEPGYEMIDVEVDGVSLGPLQEYLFESSAGVHTVEAFFGPRLYTVDVDVTGDGVVHPEASTTVVYGSDLVLEFVPADGNVVQEVIHNGLSIGDPSALNLLDIGSNHHVQVHFGTSSAPPSGLDVKQGLWLGLKADQPAVLDNTDLQGSFRYRGMGLEGFSTADPLAEVFYGDLAFDGAGNWTGQLNSVWSTGEEETAPIGGTYLLYPDGKLDFVIPAEDDEDPDTWMGFVMDGDLGEELLINEYDDIDILFSVLTALESPVSPTLTDLSGTWESRHLAIENLGDVNQGAEVALTTLSCEDGDWEAFVLAFTDAGVWESRFLTGTYLLNGENVFAFFEDGQAEPLFFADLSSDKEMLSFSRSSSGADGVKLWSGGAMKVDPFASHSKASLNGTYHFQAMEIENLNTADRGARLTDGRITFDGQGAWTGEGDLFHSDGTVQDSPTSGTYQVQPFGSFALITNDGSGGDTWIGQVASDGREILLVRAESLLPDSGIELTLPATVTEDAGTLIGAGIVTLTQPAGPDMTVQLTSSDTTEAMVPSSVTIGEGNTSATFDVTAVDDELIDGSQTAVITASAPGWASGTRALVVTDGNDTDDDGLPDPWEMQYLLTLDDGPLDDSDLDGFCNLREYLSMTDPSWNPEIPPVEGDTDYDEDADGLDLVGFLEEFGRTDCSGEPPCYHDLDGDGDVDDLDLRFFVEDFGRTE